MSKENQSSDKKPILYTDPNTGKRKIRMMPVKQKVVDNDKDDRKLTSEAIDLTRMKQLAKFGLVDKAEIAKLMLALKKMDSGKELNIREKDLIVKVMGDLATIVTGDTNTFYKAKRAVSESYEDDEPASPDEAGMAISQLKFINYAADEIMEDIQEGAAFPEWFQNKLTGTYESMKDLHAFMEGNEYEEEDDA